jgi:hypothetical protein
MVNDATPRHPRIWSFAILSAAFVICRIESCFRFGHGTAGPTSVRRARTSAATHVIRRTQRRVATKPKPAARRSGTPGKDVRPGRHMRQCSSVNDLLRVSLRIDLPHHHDLDPAPNGFERQPQARQSGVQCFECV